MKTKTIKLYEFKVSGIPNKHVQSIIDQFNNKEVTKSNIVQLDEEITFVVCDLKLAHGNLNKHSKEAWLCPTTNDGSFNVSIKF
jgi:hypothetical protein